MKRKLRSLIRKSRRSPLLHPVVRLQAQAPPLPQAPPRLHLQVARVALHLRKSLLHPMVRRSISLAGHHRKKTKFTRLAKLHLPKLHWKNPLKMTRKKLAQNSVKMIRKKKKMKRRLLTIILSQSLRKNKMMKKKKPRKRPKSRRRRNKKRRI